MSEMAPGTLSAFRRAVAADATVTAQTRETSVSIDKPPGVSERRGDEVLRTVIDRSPDGARNPAAAVLAGHRARRALFPSVRRSDPSWEILLDLYVCARAGSRVSISDACLIGGVPVSTALRHVHHLVALGYIDRVPDPSDRRRTFLHSTDTLSAAPETWFDRRPGPLQWRG
jgi:hypothetical protein